MTYKTQFWNEYDENESETQNIENGAVVTSERMNYIEYGISQNDIKGTLLEKALLNTQIGLIGLYDSPKELQSKYPKGKQGFAVVYNVENNVKAGYVYMHSGKAWYNTKQVWNGMAIADNSIGKLKIISENITVEHVNFIEDNNHSDNIFNKLSMNIIKNKYYNESGVLVSNPQYSTSQSYSCIGGDFFVVGKYNSFSPTYAAVFDENNNWIHTVKNIDGKWTIPTDNRAAWFRATYISGWENELMIVKNKNFPKSYQPYSTLLDKSIEISDENLVNKKNWVFSDNQVEFIDKENTINLFNKDDNEIIDGSVLNMEGNWQYIKDYSYSGYIPVKKNVVLYKNSNGYASLFDSSKKLISAVTQGAGNTLTTPDNDDVAFIRIAFLTKDKDNFMVIEGKNLPTYYIPYKVKKLSSDIKVSYSQLISDNNESIDKKRNIYGIGDSISTTIYASKPYWTIINEKSKEIEILMNASSGARISKTDDRTDSLMDRYQLVPKDMYAVFVFMGTNDASNILPIGENDSKDEYTLKGSMNIAIEYWMNTYPEMQIVFISPIQRYTNIGGGLRKYNLAIHEVCEKYGLAYLDGMRNSFYNTNEIVKNNLSEDGLHPNNKGHEYFSNRFKKFLESI